MTKSSVTWGNGLKVEMMRLDAMQPNPWNPNRMDEETFSKEILSIQNNGFVEPIKVRITPAGAHEIIDGEHRWRAAQKVGMVEVPVVNLGPIGDAQAKKLTIIANELRGSPEPVLLARLIKDLSEGTTLEALSLELPMSTNELDALVQSTKAFDWDSIEQSIETTTSQVNAANAIAAGERRFQLGNVKGTVAGKLGDDLLAEFNRSAAAVGSMNLETVLRHWLGRLQGTSQDTDVEAAATSATTAPPKQRKAKAKAKEDTAS